MTAEDGDGLQLDHLTKPFGALTAVRDLSISVAPGEIYGLIGPNGSGKTTAADV